MDFYQHKNLIESLIFTSYQPITVKQLMSITDINENAIVSIINELKSEYSTRGINIVEICGGYQFATNQEFAPWIKKARKDIQSSRMSQSALETLAIIAYNQPLTRIEIDQIRGVNSEGTVKSLIERRMVRIVGKKEVPGRPFLYGTTDDFLRYFGLKSLQDLPPLKDILQEEAA
ncbi:MAG: SMC-Scp complex subunit ScpB [Thermodesulfovibrionales bacterium]